MPSEQRAVFFRFALIIAGLFSIFGLAPLMHLWPSGWRWIPHNLEYEQMIITIYATLGVFLLRAAKNPANHLSLIWFFIWSCITHATVMLYHALHTHQYAHIYADIFGLYFFAAIFAYLMPKKKKR